MAKLYRSRTDSKLFGLCGGLAQVINVDSTLLRVIVIVTAFFSGGTVIPLYFIACLVIPKEPAFDFHGPQQHSPYYGPGPSQRSDYYGGPSSHEGGNANTRSSGHSTGFQPGYAPPNDPGLRAQPSAQPGVPPQRPQGFTTGPAANQPDPVREATIDEMMRDMEKKMLQREIDELRARVAQYEQKMNQEGKKE